MIPVLIPQQLPLPRPPKPELILLKKMRNECTGRGEFTVNDLFLALNDLVMNPERGAEYGRMPVRFIGPRMTGFYRVGQVRSFGDFVRLEL